MQKKKLNILIFVVLIFLIFLVLYSLPPSRTILGEWIFCRHESLPVLSFSQFLQPESIICIAEGNRASSDFTHSWVNYLCTNPRTSYFLLRIKMLKKYFSGFCKQRTVTENIDKKIGLKCKHKAYFSQSYLSQLT